MKSHWLIGVLLVGGCATEDPTATVQADLHRSHSLQNNFPILDVAGVSTTWSTAGKVDLENPFFQDFGTNGRTCGTCHTPENGWSLTPANAQVRFLLTGGRDPLFHNNDGTNSPDADLSTIEARRAASSMLLKYGDIRVGIGVPAGAEFSLVAVDDPYGYASADQLSLFRRPLPATNLPFFKTVMWDGRETGATLSEALGHQADDATLGHAQAEAPLPPDVNASVVAFESDNFTAQLVDWQAGRLDADGAQGGAQALAGVTPANDRFNLFDAWANSDDPQRAAIYRGQELFNTKTRSNGAGPCRNCHTTQNAGTSFTGAFFKIGVADGTHRLADFPLYTFQNNATGEIYQTTDPGRALITGKWADMNRFKGPILRGLASRAPYFHNGTSATLDDVVKFYDTRFHIGFTAQEATDLANFLRAL